ncbi:hypothetical protein Haur_1336 [Herpetosiphon aurantiacus DSM 785]|uniref:Uncharacterized protein n=1 Tax=Herpetosiphon aurantiacus (strain ATCC 23779 / DSM 785 / 114-95) TaxID=316274 RepID=A9B2D6_HERA2|nr:hypothetical protein Haur_1336 [Herpetosiphon aurantiacus DSM 785]
MTATIAELQNQLLEVLPESGRTDLTTESHAAAGVQVWIERDGVGWHAYLSTPTIEHQYISSRFIERNLESLKEHAVFCADEAVLDLTPKVPAAAKPAKKTRKTKKPLCACPSCTKQSNANGVFHCLKGREYVIFAAGQCLGYRKTESAADTVLREYRYAQLTKAAA